MRISSPLLARAAFDYRWLLDRGYAPRAALKLVGDRLQMTRDERMMLFRGVARSADSSARQALLLDGRSEKKLTEGFASGIARDLLVDGYNQALTVMHYLAGRPIFIGTDGLARDAGGSHGRIADQTLFERSAAALLHRLAALRPASLIVYLDAPFPGSATHASLFRSLMEAEGLPGSGIDCEALLERSADAPLKAAPAHSIVATSDSAIVDALASRGPGASSVYDARIYDAARWTIELDFGRSGLLDFRELLAATP